MIVAFVNFNSRATTVSWIYVWQLGLISHHVTQYRRRPFNEILMKLCNISSVVKRETIWKCTGHHIVMVLGGKCSRCKWFCHYHTGNLIKAKVVVGWLNSWIVENSLLSHDLLVYCGFYITEAMYTKRETKPVITFWNANNSTVCSAACSNLQQRKHQCSSLLAFVRKSTVCGFPSQKTSDAQNACLSWRQRGFIVFVQYRCLIFSVRDINSSMFMERCTRMSITSTR